MSRTIPPIPPPIGTNTGNPTSPNRTDHTSVDITNNTTTTNVAQNVVNEDLPQLLDIRGGSNVTNVHAFDVEDFSSWKYIRLANQDKRLKSIIISYLPNDVMKSVIKCTTAKAIWTDLILAHERRSDTKDTKIAALRLKFNVKALEGEKDSDLDVEEDTRSSSEFLTNLDVEIHDGALLANQKRFYKRTGRVGLAKKLIDKSNKTCFACCKLDGEERKHVLDYTHVDLRYMEDWMKNLLRKFNSLNQELSSCESELSDLKNTKSLNCSLQKEIIRLNLENDSLKDEITDLKNVIEKWTSSKVTLDQLLTEQVPGNIVRALRGRGKKKVIISSKEVLFSKATESPFKTILEITSDSESECDNLEPLPPFPKLTRVEPIGTSAGVLTLANLTLTPAVSEEI
ncbi:hypothetical protein Tco_0641454 [Tanacetum coccineum]